MAPSLIEVHCSKPLSTSTHVNEKQHVKRKSEQNNMDSEKLIESNLPHNSTRSSIKICNCQFLPETWDARAELVSRTIGNLILKYFKINYRLLLTLNNYLGGLRTRLYQQYHRFKITLLIYKYKKYFFQTLSASELPPANTTL
jgi:hypothetical protein